MRVRYQLHLILILICGLKAIWEEDSIGIILAVSLLPLVFFADKLKDDIEKDD